MNSLRFALTTSALTLVAAPALAQTDDCAAPTAINTTGVFAYDTTSNTPSGVTPCGPNFNTDAFWVWTAPADGDYEFTTCGTAYDTRIGVYAGTDCTATCIAQNDDFCGLQSTVSVNGVLTGDQLVVHVGGFGSTNVGPGVMNINPIVGCSAQTDDAFEDNDTCATAVAGPPVGVTAGLWASTTDADFYSYAMNAGDILDFTFIEAVPAADLDLNLYDGACGLIQFFNTDGLSYTSPIAQTVIVEVFVDPGFSGPGCTYYDATVALGPDPCTTTPDDSFEDNDDCASAVAMGDGQYTGLFVSSTDTDYYTVTVPDQGNLQVDLFFIHANGDTDIFLYADLATCQLDEANGHGCANALVCGFSASDNEQILWTNTTGSPQTYWMKVNEWVAGTCNSYDMVISGTGAGGPTTSIACDPANNHTGGNYAKMDGSDASGPGVFHLDCTDGPSGEFGYFLISGSLVDPGVPVSNGMLCLGAPIGRYAPAAGGALNSIGAFDGAGVFQSTSGNSTVGSGYDVLATLPAPPGGMIVSGDTWYFQCWYRDGQRSNFSNVMCVTF